VVSSHTLRNASDPTFVTLARSKQGADPSSHLPKFANLIVEASEYGIHARAESRALVFPRVYRFE
jgi:hypothetical protein